MCDSEKELTEEQREKAWSVLYDCLHYGGEDARPVTMNQSKLIVLIHNLTSEIEKLKK